MVRRVNRWYLFFVILLIAGPVWLWSSRLPVTASPGDLSPEPAVGREAPDFTLSTVSGETLQLSDLRGKAVVLNFWATWCGPCQREMPVLEAASQRFADKVVFLAVDQGEPQDIVVPYLEELGITFTVPLDEEMKVGDRYHIQGMPTTFFIDEEGIIRHLWVGEMNALILAEGITKVLP
jgi:cytochrome c biogenesis protein CcmG/thiol:disulfide interchange protein DsbE